MASLLPFGPDVLAVLIAAAFGAGFVDGIAGGGGLITVPALLLAGLDPVAAVATNKLSGTFGTAAATAAFARRGLIDTRSAALPAALAFAGSIAGSFLAIVLPSTWLQTLMPVLLVVIAAYFAFKPALGETGRTARVTTGTFAFTVAPLVGAYDGFFGPGAGSFYTLGCVALLGLGVIAATGMTKAMNLASNVGALLFFLVAGKVIWPIGLAMGVAQSTGSYIGSRAAIAVGVRLIRPLLVIVCLAMAARLLWNPLNPLRQIIGAVVGASSAGP